MPRQERILNVNDHEQTRYVTTRMLQLAGYEVVEAGTGEEALRAALAEPVDLVVLDVQLPDISGLEVCRMLKARPETASIMVMHTSATYVTSERRIAGLNSGADAYLAQPFEPPELLATVRALLRLRNAEVALRDRANDLVAADRRKDEFLAMLAHELRNPLATVVAAIPLLAHFRAAPGQFETLLDKVQRQTEHLTRMIDDLLDVSRITRGMIELRHETCDLREIVQSAVATYRDKLDGRGQQVEVALPGAPMLVRGDPTRLHQVVGNLIDNASKYSPRQAAIQIALDGDGGDVRVTVTDHGVGVDPEFLPQMFELFAQADRSLDRTDGGLGIGLSLVKTLVELHGGTVQARSAGLGRGAELEIRLPRFG